MNVILIIVAMVWVLPVVLMTIVAAPAMVVPRFRRYLVRHLVGDRGDAQDMPAATAPSVDRVAPANSDDMEPLAA